MGTAFLVLGIAAVAGADESREACASRDPLRSAFFGDLHIHTRLSFDAWGAGVRTGPEDAYAFARGEEIGVAPFDSKGVGTRRQRLATPLDFAAVTDHAEYLAETERCTTPGSPGYATDFCATVRKGGRVSATVMTVGTTSDTDQPLPREAAVCGPDAPDCPKTVSAVWGRIQRAAEAAYDRSAACRFTTFIGYEHTGTPGVSNYHRNVIFRNDRVPERPASYLETPRGHLLHESLRRECVEGRPGCDALVIPHNSNLANGKMFAPTSTARGAASLDEERSRAEDRARFERLFEIFQHKGASECNNAFAGTLGPVDELCEVEQVRRLGPITGAEPLLAQLARAREANPSVPDIGATVEDCGDAAGNGGMLGFGCVSRHDFARTLLLTGLQEERRLGVNPYRHGLMASTDTHMSTPGAVDERGYRGHLGSEASVAGRFDKTTLIGGLRSNPGGLVGVFAVENSREALFDAMQRRETFGTSGPRIVPRLFAGWDLPQDLCEQPDMTLRADLSGVAMGSELPPRPPGEPALRLFVSALRDPTQGSAPLQKVQVIKGWIDSGGAAHYAIHHVAGSAQGRGSVDEATCAMAGEGSDTLCGVLEDPDFDPAQPAYYYARVVENPTCRWNQAECAAWPTANRPSECRNDAPKTIHEMAWTSPIWFAP